MSKAVVNGVSISEAVANGVSVNEAAASKVAVNEAAANGSPASKTPTNKVPASRASATGVAARTTPTNRSPLFLVDACVWIDAYLGERQGHDAARSFIDAALGAGAELLYAIATCKDVYYLIGALLKRRASEAEGGLSAADAQAIKNISQGCLAHMRSIATAVALDESDVWMAEKLQSIHSDFEDNLVIAAALCAKADLLITTDEQLIAHSPVAALTPQDTITYLS